MVSASSPSTGGHSVLRDEDPLQDDVMTTGYCRFDSDSTNPAVSSYRVFSI
jgi:hypothetical protein